MLMESTNDDFVFYTPMNQRQRFKNEKNSITKQEGHNVQKEWASIVERANKTVRERSRKRELMKPLEQQRPLSKYSVGTEVGRAEILPLHKMLQPSGVANY